MVKTCLFVNNREPYPETCFDHISGIDMVWYQDHSDRFSLEEAITNNPTTQILITTLMDWSAAHLKQFPNLELIITITTGTDYIDKTYCQQHNIKVLNTPGFTGASVAEHAVALMLAAAKRLVDFNHKIRTGDYQIFEHQGIELFGAQAGIIGMGRIGSQVAQMLQGFGINVVYCNRTQKVSDLGVQVDLDTLLNTSDIIFLTLSLNETSRQMINQDTLAKVKPGAILINISPDDLIEFSALQSALTKGQLSYAGLDIHHEDDRFLNLPNTILTPRRAWYTQAAFERRIKIFSQTLADYMQTQP
ncbi:D-isomer specific 2-hydroxyacid dehydrogenase family protein [Roseofilum sp. BLCC_M154]|uniref:D-isomer specific 2-hydroxyacid dehydrogenase family protein n=1 Tax=Roseofilum acuticapitatum BLCC-M154 TaxID=3022444 RepID=A0ABT7ARE2_9CYAN|nr:D-isomer specific 2-hydroxyacid dehydrogenase family protein [Roseofilum acuticapitatum]MDJ1169469.1 D-isomer specific 2-hydroxyacid dehydrogenase family protein [Roseofilum acuticapitatum BLCC-M154]